MIVCAVIVWRFFGMMRDISQEARDTRSTIVIESFSLDTVDDYRKFFMNFLFIILLMSVSNGGGSLSYNWLDQQLLLQKQY